MYELYRDALLHHMEMIKDDDDKNFRVTYEDCTDSTGASDGLLDDQVMQITSDVDTKNGFHSDANDTAGDHASCPTCSEVLGPKDILCTLCENYFTITVKPCLRRMRRNMTK